MNIYSKLFQLQQEFKSAKNQENKFGKYNFRNIEIMLSELKPLLNKLGLVITFNEEFINDGFLKSTVSLIDTEDGETVSTNSICAIDSNVKGMSNSQATGCALTYSRKYSLQALLAIDDGKSDPDSMNGNDFNNNSKSQNKSLTKEEKVSNILDQINECNTIDELTALWKQIGDWTKNETIKTAFTSKKNILKQRLVKFLIK